MKTIKHLILSVLVAIAAESTIAQDFCLTHSDASDILQGVSQYQIVENSYTVRVFFHIIRRSNGTGGQTLAEVNTAINILNSDYAAHGISFSVLGIDEILDDATYNRTNFDYIHNGKYVTDLDGDGKFDLFHPNSHTDAIDIYLFANDKLYFGSAAGIPATALVIGGNNWGISYASFHVLSHEVGHCLGLYHTFHGTSGCEDGDCSELVNGSNSTVCGDFVSDTPADPQINQVNSNTCVWNGISCNGTTRDANNQLYNPNTHLIMAYVPATCMEYHTSGQGTRMRNTIANSSLLRAVTETYSSVYIGDRTYPNWIETLLGIHTFNIRGDYIEFQNGVTINASTTINATATDEIVLNPGFWAKAGSNVSIQIASQGVAAMPSVNQSEAVSETYDDVLSVKPVVEISSQIASIKVYSLTGMLVYSSNSDFDINSSGLKQGVYIIEKRYLNGRVERRKIVKR